jgi:hypothetical protein
VIDNAELRRMSPAERQELARALAELDQPDSQPLTDDPTLRRERRLALLILAGCCVVLVGWIVVFVAKLPHHFNAHHWRAVWVNFDVFLLAAFAATAWALWRERQVLILLLMITGTMLCCDAWFDVGTSLGTSGMWMSIASAVFAELPLAFLAFAGARRLLRATVIASVLAGERVMAGAHPGVDCSLRGTPLAGSGLEEALPRGGPWRSRPAADVTAGERSSVLGVSGSRGGKRGPDRVRRVPAADVLHRLPDDRQRQRRRGHRAGGVPAAGQAAG